MTNPLDPNFNPGGFEDRIDNRDFMFDEVGGATADIFDWNLGVDVEDSLPQKLVVKDQNGSYSCGGQAWAYYAEVLEALVTGTYEPRSAKFLYSQTYVPNGGSRGRDNADIFVNQGVCREALLSSYENGNSPSEAFITRSQDIEDADRMDAKLSRASAYAQTGTDIDSIALAIKMNHGVVLGVDGENNGTWNSEFPVPPNTIVWRHWIFAIGAKIINGKKHIKVINSWGTAAGKEGRQWLSEDYFKEHVFSGWTHVFAPLVVPPAFHHNFQTNMNFNDKNSEVVALQTALRLDGTFPSTVDSTGLYGDITRRAVLAFQLKYQIILSPLDSNNGKIAGPRTRAKLNSIFNSSN